MFSHYGYTGVEQYQTVRKTLRRKEGCNHYYQEQKHKVPDAIAF